MDLKDLSEMTRDDRRLVLCQILHVAIHHAHEESNFLLDENGYNDNEALQTLGSCLKEVFQLFGSLVEYYR